MCENMTGTPISMEVSPVFSDQRVPKDVITPELLMDSG
jgi:hypothetical protein